MAGHLGTGGFVTGPDDLDLGLLRAAIRERIEPPASGDLVRFTQRVRLRPRPLVWERCEPDLDWHVRRTDPVGDAQGFADLVARLMTTPLPLDRPLWELLVVPGATATGPGIVLRLHHCVSDGVGAVSLVQHLFGVDTQPAREPSAAVPSEPHRPAAGRPGRLRRLTTGASRVTAVVRATVPRTVLLGPIGRHRGVALVDVPVAPLAAAAKAHGATVNDVLLAAVAAAVEETLRADGKPVPEVLPASVPVALPDRGSSGNAVGVMLAPLPTGIDLDRRLRRIAAATDAAKEQARAQGTFELTRSRWGSRAFAWLARRQRFVALFATNVRGPARRMHVAGAPLLMAWPVAPIQGNVRFGVAAMSYDGRLAVAVHVDADALRADVAGSALEAELRRIGDGFG